MAEIAGATIDDETGEMNVKDDTTTVAAHFRFRDQFLGFSGSSGPSQVTFIPVSLSSGQASGGNSHTRFGSLIDFVVCFLSNGASRSRSVSIPPLTSDVSRVPSSSAFSFSSFLTCSE